MSKNISENIWEYSLLFNNINDVELCDFIANVHKFRIVSSSIGYETIIRHCFKYVKIKYGVKLAFDFINKFNFYRVKYKKK